MDYLITTARLGLRAWNESDLESLAVMCADPEVMRFFPETLNPIQSKSLFDRLQKCYLDNGLTYFVVELKATRTFIGFSGMLNQTYEAPFTPCIDIGWRFKKAAWGKGYATEAATACLDYAFQKKKVNEIYSVCPSINTDSESIMKKIGMKYDGSFKHPALKNYPELATCLIYKIVRAL
jgi:RimJ/RimL family protein N-acetyltransferase